MKIVINAGHGGFGLSTLALQRYIARTDSSPDVYERYIARDDPVLVELVESMGSAASGKYARLKVVEIPDNVSWTIHEYDGMEWVAETHRTWS